MAILKILGIIAILVLIVRIIIKSFIKEEYLFSEDESYRAYLKSIKYYRLFYLLLALGWLISTFFNNV